MKTEFRTPKELLTSLGFILKWIDGTFYLELNDKKIVAPNPDKDLGINLYLKLKKEFNIDCPEFKKFNF